MTKTSPAKTIRATSKTSRKKAVATSKLETLLALLDRPNGATIQDLMSATLWQAHSVRGALAGTLKKKGHSISSDIVDGTRRYRLEKAKA